MVAVWEGAAVRATESDFAAVADALKCELAALRAVWDVEAALGPFRQDRTLERRFEPHHMPKSAWSAIGFDPGGGAPWKASLALKASTREAMFAGAYEMDPDGALRACSWGGPQIMGFNHVAAGFDTVRSMVASFAASEVNQLRGFMAFVRSKGLDGALRAQDWSAFAAGYNGTGNVATYAGRLEAAYRKRSGKASPEVLSVGARGPAVRRLQEALGVQVDGAFGPGTADAVRAFQSLEGIEPDGVVGAVTWARLKARAGAHVPTKPQPLDQVMERVTPVMGQVTAGAAAVAAVQQLMPEGASAMVGWAIGGLVVIGIGAAALLVARRALAGRL